jgi:hypothetical protein
MQQVISPLFNLLSFLLLINLLNLLQSDKLILLELGELILGASDNEGVLLLNKFVFIIIIVIAVVVLVGTKIVICVLPQINILSLYFGVINVILFARVNNLNETLLVGLVILRRCGRRKHQFVHEFVIQILSGLCHLELR